MGGEKKTCMGCKWRLSVDDGYSNYTVEGTTFHCLKKLHPDMPFDEFYGEDKRLDFAQQCPGYQAGDGTSLDVDLEEEKNGDLSAYNKDPEVAVLLNAWNKE